MGGGFMAYIIENANMYKHQSIEKVSLLVDKSKILSVQPSFSKYKYMKMNANHFVMTATHVMMDLNVFEKVHHDEKEKYVIEQFLMKGCTTVLAVSTVDYNHTFNDYIEKTRNFFDETPLDYVTAVQIPFHKLTPTFIRKCKREKIPAIFVEITIDHDHQIENTAWTWIKDALFPYNCPLIPVLKTTNLNEKNYILSKWNKILKQEKVPYVDQPLMLNEPIPLDVLKKIGIYPLKGYLQTGGELSYNLYYPSKESMIQEGLKDIDESELSLIITVHKGVVIRVENKVHYDKRQGEELKISRPSFFY